MSITAPKHQPIPGDLQDLKPPTRIDAIAVLERRAGNGVPTSTLFEDSVVGRRCADGSHGTTADFCRAAKEKHDTARDNELAAIEQRLQCEYEAKRERLQAIEANNTAAMEAQTDLLRQRYLESPGTTEASFQRDLPGILAEQRRQQALSGQSEAERMAEQMRGRFSI